jgi:hypothetical protein
MGRGGERAFDLGSIGSAAAIEQHGDRAHSPILS